MELLNTVKIMNIKNKDRQQYCQIVRKMFFYKVSKLRTPVQVERSRHAWKILALNDFTCAFCIYDIYVI
jgi:hypothetical protein